MKSVQVFHVDAFTSRMFGGNAAGVVPDARGLTDEVMQQVAREMNLSETAFLFPAEAGDATLRIRYFTPSAEVDFCGHATIGAAWVLATELGWCERADAVVLETNVGDVPVYWRRDGDGELIGVTMKQMTPQVKPVTESKEEIAALLGIPLEEMDNRHPVSLAYTGNWHLLVPVRTRWAIDAATPDLPALAALNHAQGAITTHLFTFDNYGQPYDLYTRDFAPAVGIPEDPVTGSANGALSGFLALQGVLDPQQPYTLRIAQGHTVGRPGLLCVEVLPGKDGPDIRVGGAAVTTIAGHIRLGDDRWE